MKALIKSIISTLAFIFLTEAISSVSIYSLFIVAILYFAYLETDGNKNVVIIVVGIVLACLSVFYTYAFDFDSVFIIFTNISVMFKTIVIGLGYYYFFEAIINYFVNIFDKRRVG